MAAPVDEIPIKRIPLIESITIRKKVGRFWGDYLGHRTVGKTSKTSPGDSRPSSSAIFRLGKRVARRLVITLFPEFRPLFAASFDLSSRGVVSNLGGSDIDGKARVIGPSHIRFSSVGPYSYLSLNSNVSYTAIGSFCSIGTNFICGWGIHPTNGISTSPSFYSLNPANGTTFCDSNEVEERKKITIGNDVFIGMNVTVLDGVTIGDGAVIGAGAVVSRDIPPYAIAVGNPIRILMYRFDDKTISKLLDIKWWDWPDEKFPLVAEKFFDVDGFVEKYGS